MRKKTIRRPLNEVFKKKFKKFFERFAIVKTEFEILGLPRKFDTLIIETDTPFQDRLDIFSYFRKYNIVDFKSEGDELTVEGLNKVCYYFYAFLLREDAKYEDTTVTIVSTFSPFIISDEYEHEQVKKGIFAVKGLTKVDLYVVVVDELGEKDKEEYQLLRTFVSKNHRHSMIVDVFKYGTAEEQEDLLLLYEQEVFQVMEEEKIIMDVLEKRAYDIAKRLGVIQKIKQAVQKKNREALKKNREALKKNREALKLLEVEKQKAEQKTKKEAERKTHKEKLRIAIAMKEQGLDITLIAKITKLDKAFLDSLFEKLRVTDSAIYSP
jgi:predicted Fe-Mo cluster-binding NifX family protein